MRILCAALSLWAVLWLSACGDAAQERLIGTWTADVNAMLPSMVPEDVVAKLPAEAKAAALETARVMLQTLSMQFSADGKLVMRLGKDMQSAGTYAARSGKGSTVLIDATLDGKTQTIIARIDGGALKMTVDGKDLIFKK